MIACRWKIYSLIPLCYLLSRWNAIWLRCSVPFTWNTRNASYTKYRMHPCTLTQCAYIGYDARRHRHQSHVFKNFIRFQSDVCAVRAWLIWHPRIRARAQALARIQLAKILHTKSHAWNFSVYLKRIWVRYTRNTQKKKNQWPNC